MPLAQRLLKLYRSMEMSKITIKARAVVARGKLPDCRISALCMLHRCQWEQGGEFRVVETGAGVKKRQHHDEGYGLEEATGFCFLFLRLWPHEGRSCSCWTAVTMTMCTLGKRSTWKGDLRGNVEFATYFPHFRNSVGSPTASSFAFFREQWWSSWSHDLLRQWHDLSS